ncbi:radical SAM protein [Desulfovibrio inopinatus]|uniref:radical SAM protein n=1 Tax=Desulfovibrio inopinatus TaxID=102109 RepID=UPI0004170D07|nr:radical SAM protein [Desulfovibrio inopinatus]
MIHNVKQLPGPAKICIYGAGGRGTKLLADIRAYRPDLDVLCFVDSFRPSGMFHGIPLRNIADLQQDRLDYIIISSYKYDKIVEVLSERNIALPYYVYLDLLPECSQNKYPLETSKVQYDALMHFDSLSKIPLQQLNITVTNACNCRCIFCTYQKYTEKRSVMSLQTFQKTVDFMGQHGITTVDFSPLIGETLLDPGIADKIRYAKEAGMRSIKMTTNGVLLGNDIDLLKLLIEELDTISISIPGLTREAYRDVFQVDVYDKILHGLRSAGEIKAGMRKGAHINLCHRSYRRPEAIFKDDGFLKLLPFLKSGIIFFDPGDGCVDFDNWSGALDKETLLGEMRLKKTKPSPNAFPCDFIMNSSITVLPDGAFRLCPCRFLDTIYDDLVIWKQGMEPQEQHIYGAYHKSLVEDWLHGKRPRACAQCSLYRPHPAVGTTDLLSTTEK